MSGLPRQSPPASLSARRSVTFFFVALLHAGLIMGPVWLTGVIDRKPKEQMFRVKIGGSALSQGPEVGMPERTPPRPVPPEPAVKPKAKPKEPTVPTVKPKPKPQKRSDMDDVYRPPASQNTNPHVPVGTKDRAQQHAAKPDHKPPGGGLKADEAAFARYGKNVER